ncbi:MAG: thioredoxin [Gammaproteobacteria bacterium]|nr:thioredoxin [Gammaproteobacteria bacterium]
MAVITLGKDNFEEVISDNKIVIIDFWASWCAPCKMFGPVFEKAAERHPDVAFAKVNTEVEQELAQYFQVRSIPTVMIAREQIFVFSEAGALPSSAIDEILGKVRELDMDDVRKSIEQQQRA